MTETQAAEELRFDPPGPGSWEIEAVHFPRPATRYWTEVHPDAMQRGVRDFTSFYGMLIDTLDYQYVNGFAYMSPRPVAPEEAPARFQRAEEVFAGKLWREQVQAWDETVKPASIAAHREIQSVDPTALSDEELVAYLGRCRDHHSAMLSQHMRHTAAAVVPTGDFLAHAGAWTGLPSSELLGLMAGASPVSAGASGELEQLITAVARDPRATELLNSDGDPASVIEELRSLDGGTGAAVSDYLDLVGNRLLDGFDIAEPRAIELPDVLVRAIRIAVERTDGEGSDIDARITAVRDQVPPEHQAEFDELLGEARLTYRIRDERGVFSDIWASGLMRRAVLGAGERVAARGLIHEPEHLIYAGFDEMCSLVRDGVGPSADELAARAAFRATHSAKEAPAVLGDSPHPPPDPSGLPPAAGRMMGAIGIVMGELFGSSQAEHEEQKLRGLAASRGVYEGPARCISGPAEFNRIVKGDVLVTVSTTEAFNILLPLLGAIVTDSGGLLSHSAIVAREYGIPGVVGTRDATERIADGTLVRVDGDAGEVAVLG